ncbi:hypothetical protein Plhal703r1_c32g0124391 [Plasmopara halstedii]
MYSKLYRLEFLKLASTLYHDAPVYKNTSGDHVCLHKIILSEFCKFVALSIICWLNSEQTKKFRPDYDPSIKIVKLTARYVRSLCATNSCLLKRLAKIRSA